ncbi:MAG: SDR family oxidoreductase [Thiovulaceae bacterium]|nr:SDR family oxidoreductase [Sulfurimonadaceae bacterium]
MKIALITGSSKGLGKSMALHLAKKGYDIFLTYKSSKIKANAVAEDIRQNGQKCFVFQLDVSDTNSFNRFNDELLRVLDVDFKGKKLDLLINNAGVGISKSFSETTEVEFDELMNIHLKSPFFLTQMLLPNINDGGQILNVSSGLTRFSLPGYSTYAMMKGGIEVMSRYLALELGARNITVNTIAPGAIETDFGGGVVRDHEHVNSFIASQTALGRVGLPDDIGKAVAALAADDCRWINGQRIEISGGMRL